MGPPPGTAPLRAGIEPHEMTQAYAIGKGYKLYALRRQHIQLYVQFSNEVRGGRETHTYPSNATLLSSSCLTLRNPPPQVPRFAMQDEAEKILGQLTAHGFR